MKQTGIRKSPDRHCEEQSDEAIHDSQIVGVDCFAALALSLFHVKQVSTDFDVILRCALLRASKDEYGPWPILRGSLRSYLRMTAGSVWLSLIP